MRANRPMFWRAIRPRTISIKKRHPVDDPPHGGFL
jgi:hypothetical protein